MEDWKVAALICDSLDEINEKLKSNHISQGKLITINFMPSQYGLGNYYQVLYWKYIGK